MLAARQRQKANRKPTNNPSTETLARKSPLEMPHEAKCGQNSAGILQLIAHPIAQGEHSKEGADHRDDDPPRNKNQ